MERANFTFKKSAQLEKSNAKSLLGYRSKGRRTRIMVTVPSEVARNYQMAYDMIASGMNCARINCAHDSQVEWKRYDRSYQKGFYKVETQMQDYNGFGWT